MTPQKRCSKCLQFKAESDFSPKKTRYKNRTYITRQSRCKVCHSEEVQASKSYVAPMLTEVHA